MLLIDFYTHDFKPSRLGATEAALKQYVFAIHAFDQWLGRAAELRDLTDSSVRGFLAAYLAKGISASTANCKRRHLLAIWRFAVEEHAISVAPGKIRKAPEDLPEPEGWTPQEIDRVLEAARESGLWWQSLCQVLYFTGERISAVRRCTPEDLAPTGILIRKRKTHRGRWFELPASTVAICQQAVGDALVWEWPFSREWLDESFRQILRRANVRFGRGKGGLFHKLRRTSGTLVEAAGGDGARHLGNSRAVFERHYMDSRIAGGSQLRLLVTTLQVYSPTG